MPWIIPIKKTTLGMERQTILNWRYRQTAY
jgi:hypothetical protein